MGSAPSSPKHQRSNINTPGMRGGGVKATSTAINEVDTGCQAVEESLPVENGNCNNVTCNASIIDLYKQSQQSKQYSGGIMSRSMEGPRSLPVHSPASRPHSNSSTLDRK